MAAKPRNDTRDMYHLVRNNSTESAEGAGNTALNGIDIAPVLLDFNPVRFVIVKIRVLICLCGMVGNGTVIRLLGFRKKRNPYSVYILNLAIADFLYLLGAFLDSTLDYSSVYINLFREYFMQFSYQASQSLLMAVSAERCVCVLWPLWYKFHRPAHLSTILCALIWGLSFNCSLITLLCDLFRVIELHKIWLFTHTVTFITFLVLLVTGLTLVIHVQCSSSWKQPSKLYCTILLNVLVFLLLTVPRVVYSTYKGPTVFNRTLWLLLVLLSAVSSAVNPIIYFFVGRQGKQRGRKSLREVLQSALMDEEKETEQRRGITDPRQKRMTPEHQGGGAPPNLQI